jgi:hypothetical protein
MQDISYYRWSFSPDNVLPWIYRGLAEIKNLNTPLLRSKLNISPAILVESTLQYTLPYCVESSTTKRKCVKTFRFNLSTQNPKSSSAQARPPCARPRARPERENERDPCLNSNTEKRVRVANTALTYAYDDAGNRRCRSDALKALVMRTVTKHHIAVSKDCA